MRLGWKGFLPFSIGYLIFVAGILTGTNGLMTLLSMKYSSKPNYLFKRRKMGALKSFLDDDCILFFVLFPGGVVPEGFIEENDFFSHSKHFKNAFVRNVLESSNI